MSIGTEVAVDRVPTVVARLRRTGLELVYIVSGFLVAIGWFIVLVTLISLGLGLSITFVGLPILALTMSIWVAAADWERLRAQLLGISVPRPYRPVLGGSVLSRAWARTKDPAVWADLAYLILLFPVSIATFVGAVTAVGVPLSAIAVPAFYLSGSHVEVVGTHIDTAWKAVVAPLVGLALLPLVPTVVHALALVHRFLVQQLLGPRRSAQLSLQVEELSRSRSEAVAAAVAERRRIERDLHDGGQQRLTALALDLGMARAKLDSDPETARRLVGQAHEEAKLALADLRNLARGIHPAILADRGLDAALSAIAGRSPIPVEIDVMLPRRPSLTIESVAYFVVVEALTNVAKHAHAVSATVRVYEQESRIVVEIDDDGRGGAQFEHDGGLEGLATRVASVDGVLTLASPPGGPTKVRAVLPCA